MADAQSLSAQPSLSEMRPKTSPPPSPPSPDATESAAKLSRKREREVSVEPVTTPKSTVDTDPLREIRTPAKKNRRHLDSTQEEDDIVSQSRSNSVSPPLSASPRQEMKIRVRQISQGVEDINWSVEDINWRNMQGSNSENGEHEMDDNVDTLSSIVESAAPPAAEDDREMRAVNPSVVENAAPVPAEDVAQTEPESGPSIIENAAALRADQIKADLPPSPPKSPDGSQDSQLAPEISTVEPFSDENLPPIAPARPRSESESGDKGLKRKYLERGTSQGPQENGGDNEQPSETVKRPRDDNESDSNTRESKRPSPPPQPKSPRRPSPPSPKAAKKSNGFMAYASTSSPFALVKGENIFSTSKPSSIFSSAKPSLPTPVLSPNEPNALRPAFGGTLGESSTSTPTALKRSGFEAFSSSSSPFATVARSKSPVLGSASTLARNKSPSRRNHSGSPNPFASYASGPQSFAVPPAPKRARAGSPDGSSRSSLERNTTSSILETNSGADSGSDERDDRPTSFGEKLRAGKDDEEEAKSDDDQPKLVLTERDVMTGEEDEETLTQVRGKLFVLSGGTQWKERGTGLLKLNVKQDDGTGARLVMRKEAVYTLMLNVTLFPGMQCNLGQDPRYLRFSVIENGGTTHYNLRVASAKIAKELLEEITANIPAA